jgi:hypothetical protein
MYGSLQTALQALYGAERPPDATDKLLVEHGILLVASAADRMESARQFAAIEGMKQDFLEVSRILEAGGIPYVAIKGLPLAQLVYDDYAVRGISDIDVAVPLERYDDAMRVLKTAGLVHQPWDYLHKTVEILLCPGHGTYLEVHFTLSTAEGFRGFTAEFWHDQDAITVYGRSIPIPTLEVNLVYLLLHLARHLQEPRAVWIEDIRRFLLKFGDTLDWNRVVMLAGEPGEFPVERDQIVERPLAAALGALEVAFEDVFLDVHRKAQGQLGQPLARFLQLARELDFLGLVDERRRTHLAQVDRENGRRRSIDFGRRLVLTFPPGGALCFGDLGPHRIGLRLHGRVEFDGLLDHHRFARHAISILALVADSRPL